MDAAMSLNNSFEESPSSSHSTASRRHSGSTTGPSKEEQKEFLAQIAATEHKSAILALSPDHYESFIPTAMRDGYPVALASLYSPQHIGKDYGELLAESSKIELTVSTLQCDLVEQRETSDGPVCGSECVVAV